MRELIPKSCWEEKNICTESKHSIYGVRAQEYVEKIYTCAWHQFVCLFYRASYLQWSTVSLYFVLYYVDSVVFILYLHIPIWNFYKKRNKTRGTWQNWDTDENLMVHVITQPYLICKIGQSHKKTMKGSQCTTLIKVSSLLLLWMKRKMSWGHEVVYSN